MDQVHRCRGDSAVVGGVDAADRRFLRALFHFALSACNASLLLRKGFSFFNAAPTLTTELCGFASEATDGTISIEDETGGSLACSTDAWAMAVGSFFLASGRMFLRGDLVPVDSDGEVRTEGFGLVTGGGGGTVNETRLSASA